MSKKDVYLIGIGLKKLITKYSTIEYIYLIGFFWMTLDFQSKIHILTPKISPKYVFMRYVIIISLIKGKQRGKYI